MKRIAKALVTVSLVTACSAMAAGASYPSSADETIALSDVFPNSVTHQQLHENDATQQASASPIPSSAAQTIPLSATFPNMVTYQDLHKDDAVKQVSAWAYPSSAD